MELFKLLLDSNLAPHFQDNHGSSEVNVRQVSPEYDLSSQLSVIRCICFVLVR
jgi:hypothetical protein